MEGTQIQVVKENKTGTTVNVQGKNVEIPKPQKQKAIVLLSGGLDSSTAGTIAKNEGYELYALTFDYGQRHKKEIEAAQKIGKFLGVKEHLLMKFDLTAWGGSALTDKNIEVPTGRDEKEMSASIPITYVPGRNTVFLAFAASYAEAIGATKIYIGVNQVDYSGYVDCRTPFIKAMNEAIRKGITACVQKKMDIEIRTPLINWTKKDIIRRGLELKVPYKDTWSCYKGEEKACGQCDSCKLRIKAFNELGLKDPVMEG